MVNNFKCEPNENVNLANFAIFSAVYITLHTKQND